MKRKLFVSSALVAVSFCANAYAFTVSYDQETTGVWKGTIQQASIKIKDAKMRMEADTPQGRVITIMNDTVAYQYIPSENKAYKMTTKGPTNLDNLSDYKGYMETLNAKIVGSENVGDYDCDTYEFTDPGANVRARAWVWRVKNFPVKYEMDMPAGLVTTTMKNVKVNEKIDDLEFTVPAGVKIIDMQCITGQSKTGKK